MELLERFWKRVIKTETCWLWDATKRNYGYGTIQINGKAKFVHRVSYELHYGIIPDGMCVLHKCDTPSCVRPEHLFLGTRADNNKDKVFKKRHAFGSRHGKSKLTEVQVLEIREKYNQGLSQTDLAKEYNISNEAVWAIIKGKNYKHLPVTFKPRYQTEQWKQHISESEKGNVFTNEHLANLRLAHYNRRNTERSVPWNKGLTMSNEVKQKISDSRKGKGGKSLTEAAEQTRCTRISESRKGIKFSEEHKKKLSKAAINRWKNTKI